MLEASGLMVFYENMLALNNVSIHCGQHQIVGVFGANSAGKSTLMYALSGIVLDIQKKEAMAGGERITTAGSVRYRDQEIMNLSPSRRAKLGIVLCPERRRIFKESTVLENLKIGVMGDLKTESLVKGNRLVPVIGSFQNHPLITSLSGLPAEFPEYPPADPVPAHLAGHRHAYDFHSLFSARQKGAGADDLAVQPGHQKDPIPIGSGDIMQIGVLGIIQKAPMFDQSSQD